MKIGIIGLPNAGKSTLFQALTKKQVARSVRPFTTIEPNQALLEVPDERLQELAQKLKPKEVRPATITFLDIAGLVENAHQGEGLGNQFLSQIAQADLLIHLIRAFHHPRVIHPMGAINIKRDAKIINHELKQYDAKQDQAAKKLSDLPQVIVINLGEDQAPLALPEELKSALQLSAQVELELQDLSQEEKQQYRQDLLYSDTLETLIKTCYDKLKLITFYTIKGGQILQAHSLPVGSNARQAAARVHTDLAKNFIRAEVVPWDKLLKAGSWAQARARGWLATRGEDYLVQDGEVIEIKT